MAPHGCGTPRLALPLSLGLALALTACAAAPTAPPPGPATPPTSTSASEPSPAAPRQRTLTILTLNDLHGRVEALPLFAGYAANVRAARAKDGGGLLLLDGGDTMQGTLESNLGEGAAIVDGYGAVGFAATAVGNHEFDFGPVGAAATPSAPGDDPRGSLLARAASAPFPFLVANVKKRGGGAPFTGKNLQPTAMLEAAGARVGVIGLTTAELLHTTISANVADLEVEPLAAAVTREAQRLRKEGASIVVAIAHAGGKCARFTGDPAADGCHDASEAFTLARALPAGTLDAFVGGHTHAGVAHVVNGLPIVEAFSYGTHFGRVDLVLEGDPPRVARATPSPPRELCPGQPREPAWATCDAGSYEGAPVQRDAKVAAALAPHLARAAGKKAEKLGVVVEGGEVAPGYDRESQLGNLIADLLLASRKDVTVALMNGGGLRAPLPAGELTYGSLFQAFPFDNRVATVRLKASELAAIVARNMQATTGILSIGGATAKGRCVQGALQVDILVRGKRLLPDTAVTVLASDFMLTGGDAFWGSTTPPPIQESPDMMRDVVEKELRRLGRVDAKILVDPRSPRLEMPGKRPVRCPG